MTADERAASADAVPVLVTTATTYGAQSTLQSALRAFSPLVLRLT